MFRISFTQSLLGREQKGRVMATDKVVVEQSSLVTAAQMKDLWRQITDGSITGKHIQAFLEHRNPFIEQSKDFFTITDEEDSRARSRSPRPRYQCLRVPRRALRCRLPSTK